MLLSALLQVENRCFCYVGLRDFLRPGRAQPDPGNKIRDRSVRELRFRGHLKIRILVTNGFDEQALFRVTGHNGSTRIAPLKRSLPGIQVKAPFEFLTVRTVALITAVDQNRSDLLFKEFHALSPGGLAAL